VRNLATCSFTILQYSIMCQAVSRRMARVIPSEYPDEPYVAWNWVWWATLTTIRGHFGTGGLTTPRNR